MTKKIIIPLIFALVGTSFVSYSFLDTFIIPKNTRKVNLNEGIDDFFFDEPSSSISEPPFSSNPTSSSSNAENEHSLIQRPISSEESQLVNQSSEEKSSEENSSEEKSSEISSSEENSAEASSSEASSSEENNSFFTNDVVFREREHYSSPNIYIDITTHRDPEDTTTYYVADIRLKHLKYFKTALAKDTFGENVVERTSDICKRNKGILAINGDYYGAQEAGYVLRNAKILRSTVSKSNVGQNPRKNPEDLAVYRDGTFEVFNEHDYTLEQIKEKGAWQVFSFGPGLIKNGEIAVGENDEVATALSGGRNQRTAIGIIEPLHYVFVCNDGRSTTDKGFSLYQLASILKDLHCTCAYNLDGGGSSTMYLDNGTGNADKLGHLVNKPSQDWQTSSGTLGQREISDIVYIGEE